VAEEDLHQGEKKSVDAANEDDDTVRTSNLPSPPSSGGPIQQVHPPRVPHLRSESTRGQQ
jgi:hypothetical protein